MSQNNILCIFVKKETNKFDHYEVFALTKSLTKEKLLKTVEEYNADQAKTTFAKVYEDELLIEFVQDTFSSVKYNHLINCLRDICKDIDDSICSLNSWQDDIESYLNKAGGNDEN